MIRTDIYKRIMALLLCMLMLAALMSFSVLADEEYEETTAEDVLSTADDFMPDALEADAAEAEDASVDNEEPVEAAEPEDEGALEVPAPETADDPAEDAGDDGVSVDNDEDVNELPDETDNGTGNEPLPDEDTVEEEQATVIFEPMYNSHMKDETTAYFYINAYSTSGLEVYYRWQYLDTRLQPELMENGEYDYESLWQDVEGCGDMLTIFGVTDESFLNNYCYYDYRCVMTDGISMVVSNSAAINFYTGLDDDTDTGEYVSMHDPNCPEHVILLNPNNVTGEQIVAEARKWKGKGAVYRSGCSPWEDSIAWRTGYYDPLSFDCSGFVGRVMNDLGFRGANYTPSYGNTALYQNYGAGYICIDLEDQVRYGKSLNEEVAMARLGDWSGLKAGDIIAWRDSTYTTDHVIIYAGMVNGVPYCVDFTGSGIQDRAIPSSYINLFKWGARYGAEEPSYLDDCEYYSAALNVKLTTADRVYDMPTRSSTDSKVLSAGTVAVGTEFEVRGIYKNTAGEYWYKTEYKGETAYIFAGSASDYDFASAVYYSGKEFPTTHRKGYSYGVNWTVYSAKFLITTVKGYIMKGSEIMSSGQLTGLSSYQVSLGNTALDNALVFGKLGVGIYELVIDAYHINRYCPDGYSIVSTEVKDTPIRYSFAVIDGSSTESGCRVLFNMCGGEVDGPAYMFSYNATNCDRTVDTVIYTSSGFAVNTDSKGKEIAVDSNGKVIKVRSVGDETRLTVPENGMVVSMRESATAMSCFAAKVGDYCGFDPDSMIVSIYKDRSSYLINHKRVTYNKAYGTLPVPVKSGKSFAGWYTESSGGTEVTSDTICQNTNQHVLYAHWSAAFVITKQPVDVSTVSGHIYGFTIEAVGAGLSYRWQYSKDGGSSWINYSITNNATAGTAAYSNNATVTHDGYLVRCVVTDATGAKLISNSAKLNVSVAFKITKQPVSVSVIPGTAVSFSVTATGSGLSYRWQYSKNGGSSWTYFNITNNSTAAEATYKVKAKSDYNGWKIRCVVTDSSGAKLYSQAVDFAVEYPFAITQQPEDVTASAGSSISFCVKASGDGLTYRWQYSKDSGASWTPFSIANNSSAATNIYSVTVPEKYNGWLLRCVITNSKNEQLISESAKLTVLSSFKITGQPSPVSAGNGTTVKFNVTASGASEYRWQYSKDNGVSWVGFNVTNNTTAETKELVLTLAAKYDGWLVRCRVSAADGRKLYTNAVSISVG